MQYIKAIWQCSIWKSGFVGPKWQRKIYNVALRARGGWQRCGLGDSAGSMTSWALGHRGDDGTAGLGTTLVNDVVGTTMAWGAQRHGLREDDVVAGSRTASRDWDDACMVDGSTGSGQGRWQHIKGPQSWSGMTVWRLQGGLDDGTGSGKVDDGAGSREIFGGKFWQPDGVSESLWELGFAMAAQQFIYRGTRVATGRGDIIKTVATENRSSDGRLPSSSRC
jgi:hypothetical protein